MLDAPATIALLAQCAARNGAVGVRIEGAANIAATAAAVNIPIVGIVKRRHPGFEPYITATVAEIDEVAGAGAGIVAFDATLRLHPGGHGASALIAHARARGLLAMADCSEPADADGAIADGADIVATTLAGYTSATHGRPLPALDLVARIVALHPFAICEGGVAGPRHLSSAFAAGASAVVVGTAITNVDALVRGFAAAAPRNTGPALMRLRAAESH